MLQAQQEKQISFSPKNDRLKDITKDADAIVRKNLKAFTVPSQNLPTRETDRQNVQKPRSVEFKKIEENLDNSNLENQQSIDFEKFSIFNYVVKDETGFKLHFDNDITEEECRYYLKVFPDVNSIREKKIHCTSCNVHLGCAPKTEPNIRMHPILKVTLCKKCFDFYNSGEFSKGEDGSELYCRWCGQGGEVYCCAKCPYVFCKGCISLNLSRSLVNDIQENENWNCFVCAPKITWPVRAAHWALTNFLRKHKDYIMNGDHTEVQKRNLMRKDVSQCCPQRYPPLKDGDDEDDDIPLAKAIKVVSKRKLSSNSDSESTGKVAASPTQNTGKTNITIQSTAKKSKVDPIATRPTIITGSQPNKQFILNNQLIINQVTPQQAQMAKATPPSQLGQVKIVQMPTQSANIMQKLPTKQPQQHQRLPMIQPRLPVMQQKLSGFQTQQSQPPPLLIRNRGVQIRPTNIMVNPRPAISAARSTGEQTPVYHTIGGYCIDLNSAAQHDSIRLPNGKLIQVKKSTTSNTLSNANGRNQNGSSQAQLTSPQQQHHFTITQPAFPLQTAAAPAPIVSSAPPTTGTIHVVNGNQIQMPLQIQQSNTTTMIQQQQQGPRPPVLIKHIFNQTQIGKARGQLQNQIFTAMEICQHLSGKIQTLTNSNPYKNAATLGDVKELYIHLSYLFTYAIGRFKTVQEKCNEDMKNIGYRADHTKLVKGHLAAEKEQTSDTEEGELELIEPQTTTIDLDSDNEDNLASTSGVNPQQISKQPAIAQPKTSNLTEQEQNDYNFTFDLLAGMLEVNLTEDSQELSNFNKPKHPRKKTTSRPNPALIKQNREKYEQIKLNDLKLKQKCNILIEYFDLSKSQIQSAMERYCKQQDKNDDITLDDQMNYENQYELLNMLQVEVNDDENQSKEKENSKCDDDDHTNDAVDDSAEPISKNDKLNLNDKGEDKNEDKDKDIELENKENDVTGTDNEDDSGNTSQAAENEENVELDKSKHSSDSNKNEDVENSNKGESSKSEKLIVEKTDDKKTNDDENNAIEISNDENNAIEINNDDENNTIETNKDEEDNSIETNNDEENNENNNVGENNAIEIDNDDESKAIETNNDENNTVDESNAIEANNDENNTVETNNDEENNETNNVNENNDENDRNNDNDENNNNDENNDNNEENNDNNEENNDNNEENNDNEDNDNTGNEINNSENDLDITINSLINISDDVEMISLENTLDLAENESENKTDVNTDNTEKINKVSEILDSLDKSSDN